MRADTAEQTPRGATIPVVIASDVRLLCDSLAVALAASADIEVAGSAGDAEGLLREVREKRPTIVLVDISMLGALEVARLITQALSGTRVVAVAVDETVASVVACAEAGVAGYVPHDASLEQLRATVTSVATGETPCSPRITAGLFSRLATLSAEREQRPAPRPRLTPREYQVLRLIQRGLSNKQIAARLNIAVPTVKNHVHRILEKLDVARRGEAADRMRR